MTAFMVYRTDEAIRVYIDGATYDDDGICRRITSKCSVAPHASAFALANGSAEAGRIVQQQLLGRGTFDEMVEHAIEDLKRAVEFGFYDLGEFCNTRLAFGGWSESRERLEAYTVWMSGKSPTELNQGSLDVEEIAPFFATPYPNKDLLKPLLSDDGKLIVGLVSDAIAFLEAVRESKMPLSPANDLEGCLVGGFIQQVDITRDSVWTGIIHRWPDRIGEPLNTASECEGNVS